MVLAKKAHQRSMIVSGGDKILSKIEKSRIFMVEVKHQPKVAHSFFGGQYWVIQCVVCNKEE
jgi:hypothetical protein